MQFRRMLLCILCRGLCKWVEGFVSLTFCTSWGLGNRDSLGNPFLIFSLVCDLLNLDQVGKARKFQLQATEVLAELLKSKNPQATASKYLDSLTEEFFMVASTYLEMVPSCYSFNYRFTACNLG